MKPKPSFQKLLSPGAIAGMTLRNRFIMPAMGSNFAELDGNCGEKLQAYYEERAKGGTGLLILETAAVSWPMGAAMPNTVGFSSDDFVPGLRSLAERVHQHGAKIAAQLNHCGKIALEDAIAGRPLWVPSVPEPIIPDMIGLLTGEELATFIKAAGPDGTGPRYREMAQQDINSLITDFAAAARRAKAAGFDAVEIHGGHGYVISSFLSPAANKRTDHYGGSLENRGRLMCEVIKAVRAEVGSGFPILLRLDAKEFRIAGGITPADFVTTAIRAEASGVDAINVSAYGDPGKGIAFTEAPLVHQPGGFLEFAKMAKRALAIPIIAVGRIELEVAENGLQAGDFDFVGMGRKLLADPALPRKVAAGETEKIRPCIYCYACVSQIFINQPLYCAVNPNLGKEHLGQSEQDIIHTTASPKKVLIVGAGPGGLEAGRMAALAGHRVTLWEKESDLGGTGRLAAVAYEPNGRLIKFLIDSVNQLPIDIRTNTLATLDTIVAEKPDHIILATGAAYKIPEIKGNDLDHVFDGEQLRALILDNDTQALRKLRLHQRLLIALGRKAGLLNTVRSIRFWSRLWMPIHKQIIIIGGGLVALELAEFFVARGRDVQVLASTGTLAPELSIVRRSRVIHLLKERGAVLLTNAIVTEITEGEVVYQHGGETLSKKGSQVIIAEGAKPNEKLATQLEQAALTVTSIGDGSQIGYIEGAIRSAQAAVASL
ncbi:MAG: FAD-dependent oxidoreductase [Halioglobus sp.]